MTATTAQPARLRLPALRTVVLAGLAGGLVDFLYASSVFGLMRGKPIAKVWQGVASGWIGKAAGQGGWATAALGLVTHFGIAICMAAVFAFAAQRVRALARWWPLAGLAYGLALYALMYGVVLPWRFSRAYSWDGLISVGDIASHLGVGLAIAWVVSRRAARP